MPIWSQEVTMGEGFLDCLTMWTTTAPYNEHASQEIHWRLVPAFMNNQCWLWYDDFGRLRGFVTWGWMTAEEFETRDWNGWEVFARRGGERLVLIDMIAPRGHSDVVSISRDVRKYCKRYFPDVTTVWAHRGDRDGWFPNKG